MKALYLKTKTRPILVTTKDGKWVSCYDDFKLATMSLGINPNMLRAYLNGDREHDKYNFIG